MLPQCCSRRTARILFADNREHELAGTALNCLFLIEAMRARHWKRPSPYRAPSAVNLGRSDCPKLMTVPIAMATGIEIRSQSRPVRRIVKERVSQISPIQLIWRPLQELSSANEYALTARGWAEIRLIFET
jgi:hypothetical protein